MTRDEEVALVARIAGQIDPEIQDTPVAAVERALQLLEAAEQAVDSKRSGEKDWERLEAAATAVLHRWDIGDLTVAANPRETGLDIGGLRKALAACQPMGSKP